MTDGGERTDTGGGGPGRARSVPVPDDEVGRLAALRTLELLDTEPERGFDDLVHIAARSCGTPMAAVSLVDEDRQWFKARYGLDPQETPREDSFCAYTILEPGLLEVPDATADPRFADSPLVTGPPHVRFYAAAPLLTSEGQAIGTLCVLDTRQRRLERDQREMLAVLARQVMDQVQLRLTARELSHNETRFRRLLEQTTDVAAVFTPAGRILFVSPAARRLLGYPVEMLLGTDAARLLHEDDVDAARRSIREAVDDPAVPKTARVRARHVNGSWRELEVVNTSYLHDPAIAGIVVNVRDVTDEVKMARTLATTERTFSSLVEHSSDIIVVIDEGRITFVSPAVTRLLGFSVDEVLDRRVVDLVDPAHRPRTRAVLSRELSADEPNAIELRLRHADGSFLWFEARGVDQRSDPAIGGVVVNLRDIDDRKRYEDELKRRVLHDELTGLPNRALLEDRIERAVRRARDEPASCALLFIDLDRFKLVNESAGHDTGDRVLRDVADRLTAAVGAGDTVARLGADEFAVLCEDLRGIDDAVATSARLHQELEQPVHVEGRQLRVTASVGIAVLTPGTTASELVQAADVAMRAAKERGRGGTEVFQERLRTQVMDQLDLLSSLQDALERRQLFVHYQPIVDLRSRHVVGAEALARWTHAQRGAVRPDSFIPLAEEAGLIGRLGMQVLELAAAESSRWLRSSPDFFVTVNVSRLQLCAAGFSDDVVDALARTGAAPGGVVLEITESSQLGTDASTRANLAALGDVGVRLAIDDFGTGYSSLSNVKDLGADLLKIDASLVQDVSRAPEGRAVVAAIVDVGHALGLTVVAEHIEDEEQAAVLTDLGCDLAQGYLFALPGPARDLVVGSRA